ncbi:hypothetical protein PR202_gb08460 [Eleusine coracana subsp. coracana]|uniref:Alpha/beta hydrolase fold-3 domain-containing protein n=1 Tax=Eleusine coracana subsp. coracana TaxID=191504 RepID=A0AAV5EEZ7_ELECO|nr:hypothetical protein PR202_gb08460 [Eleusine coracana subsp. coracana]
MASNTAQVPEGNDNDEILHNHGIVRVYKSGRVERPLAAPPVAPGVDAATGVESKDVNLGHYSVRLYFPPAAATKLPIIVYVHGGGFVAESAASLGCHRFLNTLASACPALGVSVDYRLAPEHPLPAAYDDCLAALKWTLSLGGADPWLAAHGDLGRVFLAGDSAGANACHHLAVHPDLLALTPPPIKGAVLIHPWFWGAEAVGGEPRHPGGAGGGRAAVDVRVPRVRDRRPADEPDGARRAGAGHDGVRAGARVRRGARLPAVARAGLRRGGRRGAGRRRRRGDGDGGGGTRVLRLQAGMRQGKGDGRQDRRVRQRAVTTAREQLFCWSCRVVSHLAVYGYCVRVSLCVAWLSDENKRNSFYMMHGTIRGTSSLLL